MTESVKVIGKIIKVHSTGWGFITSKEIKFTRIFFHWTHLRQDTLPFTELRAGMMVEFTPSQMPGKGVRAVHIRVVDVPKPTTVETTEESNGIPEADTLPLV